MPGVQDHGRMPEMFRMCRVSTMSTMSRTPRMSSMYRCSGRRGCSGCAGCPRFPRCPGCPGCSGRSGCPGCPDRRSAHRDSRAYFGMLHPGLTRTRPVSTRIKLIKFAICRIVMRFWVVMLHRGNFTESVCQRCVASQVCVQVVLCMFSPAVFFVLSAWSLRGPGESISVGMLSCLVVVW